MCRASLKSSSRHLRPNTGLEANGLNAARWVVNLKCYLLSLLRIHRPDCELCNAREQYGVEMRKRLEELNWRTRARSFNNEEHDEVVRDSKPAEGLASPPISLAQQRKKIA
jgi:hypothetical protein